MILWIGVNQNRVVLGKNSKYKEMKNSIIQIGSLLKPIVFLSLLLVFSISIECLGQEKELPVKHMPAQLTLIYPLGSNGIHSYQVVNNFSVNLLAGASAGVQGFEIAGLSNFTKGNVVGAQLSGLINGNNGNVKGYQSAGLINIVKGNVVGLQHAGLVNITTRGVKGAQISGLVNTNIRQFTGVQAAGLVNSNIGDFKGLQISGGVNVVSKQINGLQIGLINLAKKMDGFQIGLVNIADSVGKGGGLGLINFYRNGYHALELESNETFYANLTFKSGVEKLYMIYTLGYKKKGGVNFWAPGIGIGSLFHLSDRLAMNVDAISRQVNEGKWWTDELNQINSLKINASYSINKRVSIYGGPSYNIVISSIKDAEGNIIGDSFSRGGFYDKTRSNTRIKMFIGVNGGIRF